jgi:hypothetical protein
MGNAIKKRKDLLTAYLAGATPEGIIALTVQISCTDNLNFCTKNFAFCKIRETTPCEDCLL